MSSEPLSTSTTAPATGAAAPESVAEAVAQLGPVIEMARSAQQQWSATPLQHRARAIRQVRDFLLDNAERLALLISQENGKTRIDAMVTEIAPAAMAADFYARRAKRRLRDRSLGNSTLLLANKRSRLRRVPWGVVGVISPWNYPFAIPFSEVICALLAGNAVLFKPATITPQTGEALADCLRQCGIPGDLVTLVRMPGRLAGPALLDAGIDKLFFTGSTRAGRQLAEHAGRLLTPISLELGGNDAMIVCADANIPRAVAAATWAGFQNAGQSCGGIERIYVHKEIYDPFLALLVSRVRTLRVGKQESHHADIGAMTSRDQLTLVREHVEDALAKGGEIAAESPCPENHRYCPAVVLTHVDHTMRVVQEETFGPVLAVMKVESDEEAVRLANDSTYGLTASIFSRSRKHANRIAEQLETGVVTINDHLMSHGLPETPWGGFKESGIGRTHGALGFDEMTQAQCVVDDAFPWLARNFWWYPHDQRVYQAAKGFIDALYGKGVFRRISGLRKLLLVVPRMLVQQRRDR